MLPFVDMSWQRAIRQGWTSTRATCRPVLHTLLPVCPRSSCFLSSWDLGSPPIMQRREGTPFRKRQDSSILETEGAAQLGATFSAPFPLAKAQAA